MAAQRRGPVKALVQPPRTRWRRSRRSSSPRRDIVDAILYVVRTGCAWAAVAFDFPPWQTAYWYFTRWEKDKVTEQILAVLRRRARAAQGRADEPTAGIIDSQRVKGADTAHERPG